MLLNRFSFVLLKAPDVVLPYVPEVCQLADKHRVALGFLPKTVFREQASLGRLWISFDTQANALAGYLLFGGRYPNLKVTQLLVPQEYRQRGVAAMLVTSLKSFAEHHGYSTLSARVAKDLPSNAFWAEQGLKVIRTVAGGKSSGRVINVRVWHVPGASLFWEPPSSDEDVAFPRSPQLDNALYVLDLNVFFDVVRRRIDRDAAQWVMSAAMAGRIHLAVAPEFSAELERHTPSFGEDPLLEFAKALPCLPDVNPTSLTSKADEIRPLVFDGPPKTGRRAPNDDSDLAHLAYCVLHGAKGFLTRERRLLEASKRLRDRFGLEVASPTDLVESEFSPPIVDRIEFGDTEVTVSTLDQTMESGVNMFLRSMLPNANVAELLARGTSHDARERLVATVDADLVGVLTVRRGAVGSKTYHAVLVVDEESRAAAHAFDQLLEHLHAQLQFGEVQRIRIRTPIDSAGLIDTLRRRGYRRIDERSIDGTVVFGKLAYVGVVPIGSWSNFAERFKAASGMDVHFDHDKLNGLPFKLLSTGSPERELSLFDFETLISPGIVGLPNRVGAIVPIRREYSRILMPEAVHQGQLFAGSVACVRIERVYFLSRNRTGLFPKDAIVVFYESSFGEGSGEAIGYGRVTYSGYLTVPEAISKLSRQGALSKERLEDMANETNRVTAFTFDSFQEFTRRIPMAVLENEILSLMLIL